MTPRRPPAHWTRVASPPNSEGWTYGGVHVISRVGKETAPDKPQLHYWWLAVEKRGRRPHDADCRRVLTAFGMPTAEEAPGKTGRARHFLAPIPLD